MIIRNAVGDILAVVRGIYLVELRYFWFTVKICTPSMVSLQALLLTTCFWLTGIVLGQDFAYRNYGTEQGLPSSEVYQITQDQDGFMWFATDQGVARFDGYSFQTFTESHGLPDKVVFGFSQDEQGRIWVFTLSRKLAYFEDGKFHEPPINHLMEEIPPHYGNISSVVVRSLDEVYVGLNLGPPYHVQDGELKQLEKSIAQHAYLSVHQLQKNQIITGLVSIPNQPYGSKAKHLNLRINGTSIPYPLTSATLGKNYSSIIDQDGDIVLCNNSVFMRIREQKVVQFQQVKAQPAVISLFQDQAGDLWASTMKQGVLRFVDGDLSQEPTVYLPELTVTSSYQDHEGNYWFSTLEDGVFFIVDFTFHHLQSQEARQPRVNCIEAQDNEVFLGMKSGEVIRLSLLPNRAYDEVKIQDGQEVRSLASFREGVVITHYGSTPSTFYQQGQELLLEAKFYFFQERNNSCWAIGRHSGFRSNMGPPWVWNELFQTNAPIVSAFVDSSSALWIGTNFGLQRFSQKEGLVDWSSRHPHLSGSVRSIVAYPPLNALILAVKSVGLVLMQGDQVQKIAIPQAWKEASFNSLQVGQNGEVWAGSNQGLFRFWPATVATAGSWERYCKADGLPSDEVHEIKLKGDTVFMATSKGGAYFDRRQLPTTRPQTKLSLTSIGVNGKTYLPGNKLSFPADSNNLSIRFFGLNYRHAGNVEYEYRLLGAEEDWVKTKALEVRYSGLAPGSYTFLVQESKGKGAVAGQLLSQEIEILPPLWSRPWFIGLSALLLLGFTSLLFYWRSRNLKNKYRLLESLYASEQKALRAQINPHFIFNALNSIQKFILSSDKHSAQKYLSIFSRIIRQSLNHSNQEFVPLSEEIELMERYVQLESLRLDHPIAFHVTMDETINPYTIEIPPMLIQPFIENAIWHGLIPKAGPGRIDLELKQVDAGKIWCNVRDNGVGIPLEQLESLAENLLEENPSGTGITGQRVKLLWKKFNVQESIQIRNQHDEQGRVVGASVELVIPANF